MRPGGAPYHLFRFGYRKRAEVFIFANTDPPMRLLIVPASELPERDGIYVRMDGRYTRRVISDWAKHENAWHYLGIDGVMAVLVQ